MRDTKEEKEGDRDRQMDTDTEKIMFCSWPASLGKGKRRQKSSGTDTWIPGGSNPSTHPPTHPCSPSSPPSLSRPAVGQAVVRMGEERVTEKVPGSSSDLGQPWGSPTQHKLLGGNQGFGMGGRAPSYPAR